jgi:hypothetical protein
MLFKLILFYKSSKGISNSRLHGIKNINQIFKFTS